MGFRSFFLSLVRCSTTTERDILDSESVASSSSSSSSSSDSQSDVVCCPSRPASPIDGHDQRSYDHFALTNQSIDDLPDDIVHLVVQTMFREDGITSIKQFSLVSRRLRAISLPHLFRYHCWRPGYPLLPSQLWDYIRFFHLILERRRGFTFKASADSEDFAAALPNMANLTRFKLTGEPDRHWVWLLNSVATLPQLSSLELVFPSQYPILIETPKTFARPPTRLVLHFHWQHLWPSHDPIPDILSLCAEQVEYLELCEGFLQLDSLHAQEWPNLREFVVCGHSFHGRKSITPVLEMMPQLRRLDLSYRCKPDSSVLVLWSPPPPEGSPSTILQQLETLAIANPSSFLHDSFRHLPPTLKSLSIIACAPPPIPLDREDLFRMLNSLRPTNLTTLRVVIDGALDDTLFSFLNSTFPCLEVLGIHRFTRGQPIEKPADVAVRLQCFKHLRLIQLNIGLQADPAIDPRCAAPRRWVEKITSSVPSIRQIAFSTPLTFFNQHWVTFTVDPSDEGTVQHKCARHGLKPYYIKWQL